MRSRGLKVAHSRSESEGGAPVAGARAQPELDHLGRAQEGERLVSTLRTAAAKGEEERTRLQESISRLKESMAAQALLLEQMTHADAAAAATDRQRSAQGERALRAKEEQYLPQPRSQ